MTNLVNGTDCVACDNCGGLTPIALLDGKPGPGHFTIKQLQAAAELGKNFDRLECAACYGPGYLRAFT